MQPEKQPVPRVSHLWHAANEFPTLAACRADLDRSVRIVVQGFRAHTAGADRHIIWGQASTLGKVMPAELECLPDGIVPWK